MIFQHSCKWTEWNNGTRQCGICGLIQYKDGSHIQNKESRKIYKKWMEEKEDNKMTERKEFIEDIEAYLEYIKLIGQENCAGSEYWELRKKHWEDKK